MACALDDLLEWAGSRTPSFHCDLSRYLSERFEPYGHKKFFFCNACDSAVDGVGSVCVNNRCRLAGIAPKRSKTGRRTSVHLLNVEVQLKSILKRTIHLISDTHNEIHEKELRGISPVLLSDTCDFPLYRGDMENVSEFRQKRLNLILTVSCDGVQFKKLSRSEAWPVYLRIEGLRFHHKNRYENIVLSGITFSRKSPSEQILGKLFRGLREEMNALQERGIEIMDKQQIRWLVFPKIRNAVIDFSGLKTMYTLPRWQSNFGCHLCAVSGERVGNRMCWYVEAPQRSDRRSNESILRDASLKTNGLKGVTSMMSLLTMERCRPDALHLIAEGVTCDLLKELFSASAKSPDIRVPNTAVPQLSETLQRTPNYTYSAKFVLGLEDFSTATGSEKESLMFVLFPLVAAERLCSRPAGSACILSFWILVRILERSSEFTTETAEVVRALATAMKNLWKEMSLFLFTLKVHVFLDHAIHEDMLFAGSPYHWTASPFESLHRRLQLRADQGTTNCEDTLIRNFVLRKELAILAEESSSHQGSEPLAKLYNAMLRDNKPRFRCDFRLKDDWFVPSHSAVSFSSLHQRHKEMMAVYDSWSFSSRLCKGDMVFASSCYWSSTKDTVQHFVCLDIERATLFGSVVVFAFNPSTLDAVALIDEFSTLDPFINLATSLEVDMENAASQTALHAVNLARRHNRFFKRVLAVHLQVRNAFHITCPATFVDAYDRAYVTSL